MMKNTYGVKINGKHSYTDFGLIMLEKKISAPEAQTKYIEVPGRNGAIDITESLTGNVRYNDRTITCRFYTDKKVADWSAFESKLQNEFQGQECKIIFDDDEAFYWIGRVSVELEVDGRNAYINMSAIVDPYKYNITSSLDEWLWDPFDFEQDVINYAANIVVAGEEEVTIICAQKWTNPIVISDSDMTVEIGGKTFEIKPGSQVLYDVIFTSGENTLTFSGNGVVSINYVGGSL